MSLYSEHTRDIFPVSVEVLPKEALRLAALFIENGSSFAITSEYSNPTVRMSRASFDCLVEDMKKAGREIV